MFCCVFEANFGMGHSPSEAFEDMLGQRGETTGETEEDLDSIDPGECFFFEEVSVVITAKSGWDIQPEDEV